MTKGTKASLHDSSTVDGLITAWRKVNSAGPYILPGDIEVLEAWPQLTVSHDSFSAYCHDPLFGGDDRRLHLGLVPIPYLGNLKKATIFLLLLNPGLAAGDYFAEERFPDYKAEILENLHQADKTDFLFLHPRLSWHCGGEYWLPRFRALANALAPEVGSFGKALDLLAQRVACLELVPYHSPKFGLPQKLIDQLESVRRMKEFVKNGLAPRAIRNEVLLIVTRAVASWGLEASENVILYSPGLARGGHFSPATPGGEAILNSLSSTKVG